LLFKSQIVINYEILAKIPGVARLIKKIRIFERMAFKEEKKFDFF